MITAEPNKMYGLVAEFDDPHALVKAARSAYAHGYRKMDSYTPIPVEGLAQVMGKHRTRLPWLTLLGGALGCFGGFFMQWFATVIHYPINVGGRPLNSWPAYIPITFELTILMAAFFTIFGMLGLNGLPMPHHPIFSAPGFKLASRDRFFLCIEATDPKFELDDTRNFLSNLHPLQVSEVPS